MITINKRKKKLTCKGNGSINGENTGFAAVVTKLSIGITRKNLAAVTAEELDGLVVGDHASSGGFGERNFGVQIWMRRRKESKGSSEDAFRGSFKPRYGSIRPLFIDRLLLISLN